MYSDFLTDLKSRIANKNIARVGLPDITLNEIRQSIEFFGINGAVFTITYYFNNKMYEVTNSFMEEITSFSSEDPKEVVDYINDKLESDKLKTVLEELGNIINEI